MKKETESIYATHYLSTHPIVMTITFSMIAALMAYIVKRIPAAEIKQWHSVYCVGAFILGACWFCMKAFRAVYSEEGLQFKWFGWRYRFVAWDHVIQAGVGKRYKGNKKMLALTLIGTPKYDQSIHVTETWYFERYFLKLIFLDATNENIANTKRLTANWII